CRYNLGVSTKHCRHITMPSRPQTSRFARIILAIFMIVGVIITMLTILMIAVSFFGLALAL
ncbi:MAG: hypothetical protein AB7H80_15840, partial [Candidatus Kapaibacterium sp.]